MSDLKLKELEKRIEELEKIIAGHEARISSLEETGFTTEYFIPEMGQQFDFNGPGDDFQIEFVPDPEFMESLRQGMHQAVEAGQAAAESGGGPIKKADIIHFPGLSAEDFERRCPHDDKVCKHDCEGLECWRELNGG